MNMHMNQFSGNPGTKKRRKKTIKIQKIIIVLQLFHYIRSIIITCIQLYILYPALKVKVKVKASAHSDILHIYKVGGVSPAYVWYRG
jgi:hypothetical protein